MRLILLGFLVLSLSKTLAQSDYLDYHRSIIQIEELTVQKRYNHALAELDKLFDTYSFVFLRDIKVAAQLAVLTYKKDKALDYIKKGIAKGWSPKAISKNKLLEPLLIGPKWESIKKNYSSNPEHLDINYTLRLQVQEMFKRDQKKALGALFRVGNKSQEKYGAKKFAPHSEKQIAELDQILDKNGYPGEMLIANNMWTAAILNHHNSISESYVKQDTLFNYLQPKLLKALKNGQMAPHEYAIAVDWKTAVENNHGSSSYGYLGAINNKRAVEEINKNRAEIGLRSLELRNLLVELAEENDMNFYLPGEPWQEGKINF